MADPGLKPFAITFQPVGLEIGFALLVLELPGSPAVGSAGGWVVCGLQLVVAD